MNFDLNGIGAIKMTLQSGKELPKAARPRQLFLILGWAYRLGLLALFSCYRRDARSERAGGRFVR
jgi:hypothetical protein